MSARTMTIQTRREFHPGYGNPVAWDTLEAAQTFAAELGLDRFREDEVRNHSHVLRHRVWTLVTAPWPPSECWKPGPWRDGKPLSGAEVERRIEHMDDWGGAQRTAEPPAPHVVRYCDGCGQEVDHGPFCRSCEQYG